MGALVIVVGITLIMTVIDTLLMIEKVSLVSLVEDLEESYSPSIQHYLQPLPVCNGLVLVPRFGVGGIG